MFQGVCDLAGIVEREDASLELQRVAVTRNLLRPIVISVVMVRFRRHLQLTS